MTTIADNLRAELHARGVVSKCTVMAAHHLIRVDYADRTRVIKVAHAARILEALRENAGDPIEILRVTK